MDINTNNKPPYIAVKKITTLLEKVTSRSYDKIDRHTLMESYGFSDGESSQAIGTLAFLGIVRPDKTINKDLVATIGARNEVKKAEGVKAMVENAYRDLFKAFPDVASSAINDIHDEMKRVYDLSPRIANTAVPAFVYLCELAGLREKRESQTKSANSLRLSKSHTPSKTHDTVAKPQHTAIVGQNNLVIDFADGAIKLALPQRIMSSPDLIDDYKTLVSAVNKFVDKYMATLTPPAIKNDNE